MKKFIFFWLILSLLSPPVFATEIVPELARAVESEISAVETPGFSFGEIAQNIINGDVTFSFHSCLQWVVDVFAGDCKENITLIIKMTVLAALSGVLCKVSPVGNSGEQGPVFLVCFALVAGLGIHVVLQLLVLAEQCIDSLLCFVVSLLPIMASLVATAKPGATLTFYPSLFSAMQFFILICKQIIIPVLPVLTGLSFCNALGNHFTLTGLSDLLKKVIKWGLGFLLTVFAGILGVHSFSAFAANSLAGRTVKYALTNFVPLVGGVLAESAEAVIVSVRLLNSTLGIAGGIAITFLCALPLLKIISVSLLLRFSSGILEPVAHRKIVVFLTELADIITLLFSLVLMIAVMFIITIALLCGISM